MLNKIPVFLSDEDSKKFAQFMEHYELLSTLMDSGICAMKNANVTLHFDTLGHLRTIHRNDVLYTRKEKPLSTPIVPKQLAEKVR